MRWILSVALLLLTGIAVGAPVTGGVVSGHLINVALLFLLRQDLPLLPLMFIPLLLPMRSETRTAWASAGISRRRGVVAIALVLLMVCWWGHYAVLNGYDYSRDEKMANFDASIFSRAHLVWPIPVMWRPFAAALNQTFILPIGDHEAWVSAYLPVNAAFRAVVGLLLDPALTSPLFVALGALSLWRISLRLFPDSPSSRAVALVLYACSSQVLFMGMTSYAMSAHLGLDLLWLMLFLREDARGHVGAIIVGFLATGLHQPLFHPLFVLPFLYLLWHRRDWRVLVAYVSAYAAIGLFWMAWPIWMSAYGSVVATAAPPVSFVARLHAALQPFGLMSAWLMASNLLRFVLWQHLMLMPLVVIGIVACWRETPMVRALALGLGLPIVTMALLLPQQGHGWGYRYLQGVIGNACLLGAFGWRWLEENGRLPGSAFRWTSLATLLVAIPVHAWMAHEMTLPVAAADRRIAYIRAPIVIIDDAAAPFANELALNRPDLSNRPIRLRGSELAPSGIAALCRMGALAFIDGPAFADLDKVYAHVVPERATPHQLELEAAARTDGCVSAVIHGLEPR